MRIINQLKLAGASILVSVIALGAPLQAFAAVSNPAPAAKISFTFDDGYASALTQAATTLHKYGLTGTDYVISGCVGMTTAPNSCHANTDAIYMTWAQIANLQSTYKWEIGSHTVTHPYLATSDATDGQPKVLTPAQVTTELTKSKTDLANHGITATDFASPYGDYNNAVLAQIAKLYASHRGFADQNNNLWPYNEYLINDFPVQEGVTVAQVKTRIDQAIAGKQWLVLTMHDIKTAPSTDPNDYEYSTAELDQIASYVKTKQTAGLIQPLNVNQGLVTSDTNLLANGSFNSGIADGWTTDSPVSVTKDVGSNGSYPDATNSIKFVASAANERLFSPKVAVDPATTYALKNFLNVQKLTAGQVEFYIDEYDANGNWISGQYKAAEKSSFVENMNFTYKPSSAAVAKASLQITVTGNSGITAYLDNSQWFPLSTSSVVRTNFVANGTFDSGISTGWTTDGATNITADAANNGSPANLVHSVKLASTTKNTHLFSPQVVADSTKSYSLSAYLNLKQISGTGSVVGFYIDEYDANGNWISGQYKTGARTIGANTYGFSYTPSSATVKKASLQVIVMANSGTLAYIDDVKWYQN